MSERRQIGKYVVSDFLTAAVAWFVFNLCRYYQLVVYNEATSLAHFLTYRSVLLGEFCIPFFWLVIYYFSGYYNRPILRSRITEIWLTFVSSLIGVTTIFFVLVIDEMPASYRVYYYFLTEMFVLHFGFTYAARLFLTNGIIQDIKAGRIIRRVLFFGVGDQARTLSEQLKRLGYQTVGFIRVTPAETARVDSNKIVGDAEHFDQLLSQYAADELIVASEALQGSDLSILLYRLFPYKRSIKVWVDKRTSLFSKVRLNTPLSVPLVDVTENNFSPAARNIKLWGDRLVSVCMLVLLSPLFLYVAWRVKRDSPGPIFYKQERIGLHGKPFWIYKFRTMYTGAEANGPMLSKEDDKRITPFGSIMRKYRLDELPQFWNVLKGDMALVGPRPERKYYIDQIVQRAPYYYLLHNVRPGITSLGMVKYGYAGNVDQMLERLEYDLLYYENMSLTLDLAILLYTVKTVVTGKGI